MVLYCISAKILDPILHIIGVEDRGKQFKKAHPIPNAVFMLLTKDDTAMLGSGSIQRDIVSVVGAQNIAKARGACEVVRITVTQKAKIADGHRLNTAAL